MNDNNEYEMPLVLICIKFKSHYKTIKQIINEEALRLALEKKNSEELRQKIIKQEKEIMKDKQKIEKQKQKIQILEKRVHPTQVIYYHYYLLCFF